jgi:hypothetical protein
MMMPAPTVPPASGPQPSALAASPRPESLNPRRRKCRRKGTLAISMLPMTTNAPLPVSRVYAHAPIAQVGTALASTIRTQRASTKRRNAANRLPLVNSAEGEMIGTTGSAPTIGTKTSGISAPVP